LRDLKTLGAEVIVVGRSAATRDRALVGGADEVVSDIDALPARLDGAVVAAPTQSRVAVIQRLSRFDVPIFVEKPLASTVEAARTVIATCPRRVYVMEKWRYHPAIERLRTLLVSGDLGQPIGISTARVGWSMGDSEVDAICRLIPHDLSIVDHILGRLPDPVAAFPDPLGPPGSGMLAVLGASDAPRATIHVSINHPVTLRSVVVSGSAAVASLSGSYDDSLVLMIGPPGARHAEQKKVPIHGALPLFAELERFLAYLHGGPAPLAPAEESLRMVETIARLRTLAGIGHPTDCSAG
jgi:predicted dehydrogenase